MPTKYTAALAVILVAFVLSGLLMLFIWLQTRSKQLATHGEEDPYTFKDKLHTPRRLHQSARLCSALPVTNTSHRGWTAHAKTNEDAAPDTLHIKRGSATLTTAQPVWLGSRRQLDAVLDSPIDYRSPSGSKRKSLRRFTSDPECAWPKPLLLTKTQQRDSLEQQPWRNSRGGSSCYSRPSSWYSAANRSELQETDSSHEFQVDLGLRIPVN